MYLTGIIE